MSRPAGLKWIVVAGVVVGSAVWTRQGAGRRRSPDGPDICRTAQGTRTARPGARYLKVLRADSGSAAQDQGTLDYEEGRTLIDEAAKSGDLVLREDLLKEAREKLEAFVKAHPRASRRPATPWSIWPSS